MKILYITYVDLDNAASGSGVRPGRMLRAFREEGHEIKLLTGSQERRYRERRRAAVAEISAWLETDRPDLCYIESPVLPILWAFDRRLIRKIHRKGIPIGFFYRDFHRRFPDLFPRRKDLLGRCKERWLDMLRRRTDAMLKNADIVYLPSRTAAELFDYRDMRPLPPAGEDRLPPEAPTGQTSIYVGGIVGTYDGAQLLDAFSLLNQEGDYPLILVCREKEWRLLEHPEKNAPWLEVRHVSGEALEPLYRRAALGLCLNTPNPYDRYTVSVKLYEYMSYGLPMVVNAAPEMERIVTEKGTGFAVPYGAGYAAEAVRRFFGDGELRVRTWENIRRSLLEEDLWAHRVRQIIRELDEGGNR